MSSPPEAIIPPGINPLHSVATPDGQILTIAGTDAAGNPVTFIISPQSFTINSPAAGTAAADAWNSLLEQTGPDGSQTAQWVDVLPQVAPHVYVTVVTSPSPSSSNPPTPTPPPETTPVIFTDNGVPYAVVEMEVDEDQPHVPFRAFAPFTEESSIPPPSPPPPSATPSSSESPPPLSPLGDDDIPPLLHFAPPPVHTSEDEEYDPRSTHSSLYSPSSSPPSSIAPSIFDAAHSPSSSLPDLVPDSRSLSSQNLAALPPSTMYLHACSQILSLNPVGIEDPGLPRYSLSQPGSPSTSAQNTNCQDAPLLFVYRTEQPDSWGHADAYRACITTHGSPFVIANTVPPHGLPPLPHSHPLTYILRGRPVPRLVYHVTFNSTQALEGVGTVDNHPLLIPIARSVSDGSSGENLHGESALLNDLIAMTTDTFAEVPPPESSRWNTQHASVYQRAVFWRISQFELDTVDPQHTPTDPVSAPIPYPQRLPYSDPERLSALYPDDYARFRTRRPKAPSDTLGITLDPPRRWPAPPLDEAYDLYFGSTAYKNPLTANSDLLVFNVWSKQLEGPRYVRAYVRESFIQLAHYMTTVDVRKFIDSLSPSDDLCGTRHYFYRHCFSFRFIHPNVPFWEQGFQTVCVHNSGSTIPSLPHTSRTAYFPRSPLLTWEEDEFLYHCAVVCHLRGERALYNSIQDLRHANGLPFSAELYILFINGYLDPIMQYDREGVRYPILWTAPRILEDDSVGYASD